MAENSKIEWTDHTWTPVVGCDAVSPACAHCYAALMAARLEAIGVEKYAGLATRIGNVGKWTGKVTLWEPDLEKPLSVKRPGRWFLTSMGDIFHKLVPFAFLERTFDVMERASHHTFYVLTKRESRALEFLAHRRPLQNVLIGNTVENQQQADLRYPAMEAIARLRWRTFVSYEPALGPVDWAGWNFLSWMISGGESGSKARPSHPDWHRMARDFAMVNAIPYLFKQWGEWLPASSEQFQLLSVSDRRFAAMAEYVDPVDGMYHVGKKAAGRLLDGIEHNGFPPELQIRQMPTGLGGI